jgi:hypothetical protein
VRIHLAGEHALEFELLDLHGQPVDIARYGFGGAGIVLGFGQLEKLIRAAQAFAERTDAVDDAVKLRALLAELLRTLRIVPDVRVFELAAYFLEPIALGIVVKDTP